MIGKRLVGGSHQRMNLMDEAATVTGVSTLLEDRDLGALLSHPSCIPDVLLLLSCPTPSFSSFPTSSFSLSVRSVTPPVRETAARQVHRGPRSRDRRARLGRPRQRA